MEKLIRPSLLLLSCILLLQACCLKKEEFHYTIDAATFAAMPYDSNSTFVMVDTAGHQNHFHVTAYSLKEDLLEACAECCRNNFGQSYRLTFTGDNPAISIEVALEQTGYKGQPSPAAIHIFSSQSEFYINAAFLDCQDPNYGCQDSLLIGGRWVNDVITETDNGRFTPEDSSRIFQIYYNKAGGLQKYVTLQGEVWELNP